jgi:hypothetical protein
MSTDNGSKMDRPPCYETDPAKVFGGCVAGPGCDGCAADRSHAGAKPEADVVEKLDALLTFAEKAAPGLQTPALIRASTPGLREKFYKEHARCEDCGGTGWARVHAGNDEWPLKRCSCGGESSTPSVVVRNRETGATTEHTHADLREQRILVESTYYGRPMSELSREELITALEECGRAMREMEQRLRDRTKLGVGR